jgi:TonB family protein
MPWCYALGSRVNAPQRKAVTAYRSFRRGGRGLLWRFALMAGCALGSDPAGATPPKVVHKVDPLYTREARRAGVQGTVLLEAVIDENGIAVKLNVLSSLGFGLDDRAVEAVSQWQFEPGRRSGQPVETTTVVPVDFRLFHRWFDPKPEEHRTAYNLAVEAIQEHMRDEQTLETIKDLARQKYPPAMYLYAKLLDAGDGFPQDREQALRLIVEAANQNQPAAMYDTGRMMMEGKRLPVDTEKGVELMRNAAVLGHRRAQFHLGVAYESGRDVPQDLDRARRYFRLCASLGEAPCQVRLAKLLLDRADRRERDLVQAITWLELAADHGSMHAKMMLDEQRPDLSEKQLAWVAKLKPQLAAAK